MKLAAKFLALPLTVAALAVASVGAASAAGNLINNPGFNGVAGQNPPQDLFPGNTNISGWYNGADYTLWVPANKTADQSFNGLLGVAGPAYGVQNGLTAGPDGTNYVVLDGDSSFRGTGLSQHVSGLQTGMKYTLTFEYAGGQEYSITGPNSESFQVTLGDQVFTTPVLQNVSQGFTGWHTYTTSFTYDGVGNLLTFLSVGTPSGGPPWALLDSPSLTTSGVPEPSTWAMMLLGFASLGYAGVRSQRRKAAESA